MAALLSEAPKDLSTLEPQLPADLLAIVRKAMARAAGERYASAKELAADLQRFQSGRLVAARTYSAADLLRHFVRRYRAVVRTTAVGAGFLVILAVYGYGKILEQRRIAEERREQAVTAQEAESVMRAVADARADEAQRVAAQQMLETGRQLLYKDNEPQRALVPLSRAYQLTPRDDLRRLVDEAAALAGNLEAFLPDVVDFRYSDSGAAVVTWSLDNSVTVWGAHSGETIQRIQADGRVKWAVFAPASEERVLVGTSAGLRLYRNELLEWALPEAIGDDTVVLPSPGYPDVVLLVGSHGSAAVESSTGKFRQIPGMQGSSLTIIDRAVWSRPWVVLPRSPTFGPTFPTVVDRYTTAGRRVSGSLEFRRDWECVFRTDLGTDSGLIWAPIPA